MTPKAGVRTSRIKLEDRENPGRCQKPGYPKRTGIWDWAGHKRAKQTPLMATVIIHRQRGRKNPTRML